MGDANATTRDFTDRALRELLTKPDNLRAVVVETLPAIASRFDFDRMRPARREYFLGNWRSREADLLFEVPFLDDQSDSWPLVCLLIEHQIQTDWRIPLKTFIYAALYWEWQWRLWEQATEEARPPFQLTPVLPIVLFTGLRPWGSARRLPELFGAPTQLHSFVPDWAPVFWELSAHSPEELLNADEALLQVFAVLRVEGEERERAEQIYRQALLRLNALHDGNRVRWQDLVEFLMGWAFNRRPAAERSHWMDLSEQIQSEEQRRREIRQMGQTIAQSIYQEGKAEGIVEGKRSFLFDIAFERFGEPEPAERQSLERISDLPRLERMVRSFLKVSSWSELLDIK